MDWKPIESAPRDGTSILVYVPAPTVGGRVMQASWSADWYGDKTNQGWMPANCDEEYGCHYVATHWMPLPSPPKEQT